MSTSTINLTPAVYTYLQNYSLREPALLKQLREETNRTFTDNMQISPEQGQFMQLLITLIGAKRTLDIGTFTGYSALAVALTLPDTGKVVACDTSVEWTTMAKKFWEMANVSHKIELMLAPAIDSLNALIADGQTGTFDFCFIDADKINYDAYYEKALLLLRAGGLIAIDNVLWGGQVADQQFQDIDTKAIRALNAKILNDDRVILSMLPIGDGLTLARKC